MKRLGELLLEKGAVTIAELHTGLDMTRRRGGRLGTHLLRLGFVEEEALLQALEVQFGVRPISERELEAVPEEIRNIVPPELRQRYGVVPVARLGNVLELAMINPLDPEVREGVEKATGMMIRPRVATETAIRRFAGDLPADVEELAGEADAGGTRRRVPPPEAWDAFWSLPPAGPEAFRLAAPARGESGPMVQVGFPDLRELIGAGLADGGDTLDLGALLARLPAVTHRDQVADLLLRYLNRYLDRVALFVVHKNRVVGWSARGEGAVMDDIQSLIIPLDRPSIFLNLRHSGTYYAGPIPPGEANHVLAEALGSPPPEEVLAVPIRIKGRPVMYAFGDSPGMRLAELPVDEIAEACSRAGLALEILILRSKITAG